jgi:hypothetical protein
MNEGASERMRRIWDRFRGHGKVTGRSYEGHNGRRTHMAILLRRIYAANCMIYDTFDMLKRGTERGKNMDSVPPISD